MSLLCTLLFYYQLVVVLRIVLGMIVVFGRMPFGHPARRFEELLARVVDPVLRPLRAIIPTVPAGGVSLDLSPLVLIVGISILQGAIC